MTAGETTPEDGSEISSRNNSRYQARITECYTTTPLQILTFKKVAQDTEKYRKWIFDLMP